MATSNAEALIRARVTAFTDELSSLIRSAALEAVEEALGGVGTKSPGRPRGAKSAGRSAVKRAPKKGGKRVRRTAQDLEQLMDDIQAYVTKHKGQRLEEMSAGMDLDSKEMKRPIVLLLEQKRIIKEGAKRGTRYFVGPKGKRK
ncbi:MAG: hypothetical protein ACI9F9_000406 [Candidatus Paceibacteria bacterium]|jgi:hypothetical protein